MSSTRRRSRAPVRYSDRSHGRARNGEREHQRGYRRYHGGHTRGYSQTNGYSRGRQPSQSYGYPYSRSYGDSYGASRRGKTTTAAYERLPGYAYFPGVSMRSWARMVVRENPAPLHEGFFEVRDTWVSRATYKLEGTHPLHSRHRRALRDASGRLLYFVHAPRLSPRGALRVKDARSGTLVATIRRAHPVALRGHASCTLRVWRGFDVGPPWLQVHGAMHSSRFPIIHAASGTLVAYVRRRRFSITSVLLDRVSFVLRVRDPHHTPLMVLVAVAIDHNFKF